LIFLFQNVSWWKSREMVSDCGKAKKEIPAHFSSLMLQAVGRIGSGRPQGLQADSEHSHAQADRRGEKESPDLDIGPVGELFDPGMHGEIGGGPCNEGGSGYPLQEILVEERHDAGCG